MTEKRFSIGMLKTYVNDNEKNYCYSLESPSEANHLCNLLNELAEENKEFKQHVKGLEKEIYLQHMRSMFSTVKSFKGDVSKRYYYSEKTDTLYDTANNYGQYNKILDKKEIAMLLNEYETLLNGGDLNDYE